ncbi:J domain-containing protein [Gilvimarinus chinensis]|uniref:J domain-containing protein n=1 Tax=Gilvimarinus chinensis TaxID=396005 RepID=UPI0003669A7E|nr:J domain-containing protein [Gilvimarinus chinensis]
MKNEDAAKILGITGEINPDTVKQAYRRASSKYHPDKGGSVEMMQAVNQAYDTLKDFSGDVDAGDLDYGDLLNEALNAIINLQGINIEVCGAWIWVTGDTRPHKDALGKNGAGFFWAKKKKAWYFRPSDYKSAGRGKFSLDDIRERHGSQIIKTKTPQRLAS